MPIYVTQETYDAAKRVFPYLMALPTDPGLFVAQLDWRIIKPYEPFTVTLPPPPILLLVLIVVVVDRWDDYHALACGSRRGLYLYRL